ncbi:MAG: DUF3365 domain-containing protein [Bacteroidetes bacterium]|nr:DUF3365 domain-containing protein [Bacteroidota bacterium]
MKKTVIILFIALLSACNNRSSNIKDQEMVKEEQVLDTAKFLAIGKEMASQTQQILLSNVSNAIKEFGVPGAVNFCNTKAVYLTDSASEMFMAQIGRVSAKNRNPNNALNTNLDKTAWEEISKMMADKVITDKHLILQEDNEVYYYKAIPIAMPACLACHGEVGKDVSQETFDVIKSVYPNDKAIGYEMGQLRGLWKIKLNTEL